MIGKTNCKVAQAESVEHANITLKTNQSSHGDLVGAKFTLSYGTYSKEYTWDGSETTVSVPAYAAYTIAFGAVDGYKAPASVTYTAQAGNARNVEVTYQCELVRVTLSASNGASVSGQTVTINGQQFTYGTNTVEKKVPFGTQYTVSVNDMDGFTTPASQTFTAAESVRNLAMVYEETLLGVFAQGENGKLYTKDFFPGDGSWPDNIYGIAVLTANCQFVIGFEDVYRNKFIDTYDDLTLISGIVTTDNTSEAFADFNGESNTLAIMRYADTLSYSQYAAEECYISTLSDGRRGYLGSAGEWKAVVDNYDSIQEMFNLVGESKLSDYYYWTSTQSSDEYMWVAVLDSRMEVSRLGYKNSNCSARPFYPIK